MDNDSLTPQQIASRKSYLKHKEERMAKQKAWRESHAEEDAARHRAHYEANKDTILARQKARKKANPEGASQRQREADARFRAKKRAENPPEPGPSIEERFMARVSPCPETGCWLWTGHCRATPGKEYATMKNEDGDTVAAHRWSYEHFKGKIPEGLEIDHTCTVKSCVNPNHLEPVTGLVNIRRRKERTGFHVTPKTHCPQGHEYTPENTVWSGPEKQYRNCRTCRNERSMQYYIEHKI